MNNVSLQVNKPYLPLASGEYSFKTGVLIVASFSIMVSVESSHYQLEFKHE